MQLQKNEPPGWVLYVRNFTTVLAFGYHWLKACLSHVNNLLKIHESMNNPWIIHEFMDYSWIIHIFCKAFKQYHLGTVEQDPWSSSAWIWIIYECWDPWNDKGPFEIIILVTANVILIRRKLTNQLEKLQNPWIIHEFMDFAILGHLWNDNANCEYFSEAFASDSRRWGVAKRLAAFTILHYKFSKTRGSSFPGWFLRLWLYSR